MTDIATGARALVLSRRFDASLERLFDAWTNPDVAARWLFTSATSETHAAELDVRVGGEWTITDWRDGVEYRAIGEYLAVERPRRLVFTFGMPQFSPEFATVTVEIVADGPGSRMTLTQTPVPPEAHAGLEAGWNAMFDALAGI